jgi:hypothetical protein
MVPRKLYVQNLVIAENYKHVEGCIVECGVWKGGMIAGIADLISTKKAYLFDSYQGLPPSKDLDGKEAKEWQENVKGQYYYDNCSADERYALEAMKLSGVEFESIKGWFNESFERTTLPPIAILRLDADWYDSTMDCMMHLYPKVSIGGVIIIDDYHTWEGCSKAIHDYLSLKKLKSTIQSRGNIAFIKKLD